MDNKLSTDISNQQRSKTEFEEETTKHFDIEAPLSPVLTSSKKSLRHIARCRSRIKLFNTQNSESQSENSTLFDEQDRIFTETPVEPLISDLKPEIVVPVSNKDNNLEERMKRILEMERNKKFFYNIAQSSSKIDSKDKNVVENDKIDFNFKIPESPVSTTKIKKNKTIIDSNINCNVGFETGSGKKINLSERAVKKAAKLFDDIMDVSTEASTAKNECSETVCFKTASGNTLNISENSVLKGKTLFEDIYDLSTYNKMKNSSLDSSSDSELSDSFNQALFNDSFDTKTDKDASINKDMFSQMTDTQICLVAENAEYVADFTQWTSSPNEKTQKTQNKDAKSQNDEFSSPEAEQFFGNLTLREDGTVGTRNKEIKADDELKNSTDFKEISFCGFNTASGKKITVTKESLNKLQSLFSDIIADSNEEFAEIPEKELQISEELLGFTWEEALKSLKITELYKRSIKYIEKDVKNTFFYPISFTFDDIQSSKGYKNKNYKYSLRKRKPATVYKQKKQCKTPITPRNSDLVDTTVMTRSKKNTPKSETIPNYKENKSGIQISLNYKKNIEALEDSFLSSIESQENIDLSASHKLGNNQKQFVLEKMKQNFNERPIQIKIESNKEFRGIKNEFQDKENICNNIFEFSALPFENILRDKLNTPMDTNTISFFKESPKNASFGFTTASGKNIPISEKNLKKAKIMFEECDTNDINLSKIYSGFETGESLTKAENIDRLIVDKNATNFFIQEAKNVFKDCDIDDKIADKSFENVGFATASGKKFAISEKSLEKARNIFKDCDIDNKITGTNYESPKNVESVRFATASGKMVSISEESLIKAKNLFQDCEADKTVVSSKNVGFATASGKQILISEKSLIEAKNLFQDYEVDQIESSTASASTGFTTVSDCEVEQAESSTASASVGFVTASGKKVSISEESLIKAKNLFQDCEADPQIAHKFIESSKDVTSVGFVTASGKKVSISEASLNKAKNLFQDCAVDPQIAHTTAEPSTASVSIGFATVSDCAESSTASTSIGFVTASGKKVSISEASLIKAKNLFQDVEADPQIVDKTAEPSTASASIGFATASGKKVLISEESLIKAKNLFQDVEVGSTKSSTTSVSIGFATASGKKVSISEESLIKAKNLFEDCEADPQIADKTASGNTVLISEESLAKAKNKLQDCDIDKNIGSPTASKKNVPISEESCKKEIPENLSSSQSTIDSKLQNVLNKSHISPQITSNIFTPITNRNSSLKSSKKRSLGISSCRQIDISENTLKRAKLIFDDIDTPKKKETIINNNNLVNYSPLNLNSSRTPRFAVSAQNSPKIVTDKLSPPAKIDSSFVLQEQTQGDPKKWNTNLQLELDKLKIKMSIIETRMLMLNKQQEIIQNGSLDHRRQRPGSLLSQKSACKNRLSLKEAVKNRRPLKICFKPGLDPSLLEITSENSCSLHFHVSQTHPVVTQTEDGAVIIPNHQNLVGLSEIQQAFLAMPGVDPSLVPKKWVSNHYRWIVWKLASLERSFTDVFKDCLQIEQVMSQLKYRYDREIDRAQRPALRKIVECDDSPAKRMVLCVAAINKINENKYELELTDGWYSIKTVLDVPLNSLIERNLIKIGTKLITHGAELLNCEGCCPLELPPNVRLQIHFNSTRRAAWHVKLGYQPNPGPLRISLRMIANNGGPIGAIHAYVARVYPITFMERSDAGITWRNQRAEMRRANQWDAEYANKMEKIQIQVQQELEKEWRENKKKDKNQKLKIKDLKDVSCGELLYKFLEASPDPDSIKELLSSAQISALLDYQTELSSLRQNELTTRFHEKLSKEKLQPRNVSTVLKVLLVDVESLFHHRMLSIWRPSEAHTQLLKEGIVFNIYNLSAKNNGTLSSTPRTQFNEDTNLDTEKFENLIRFVLPIAQTANSDLKLFFGEFDTVGMVVTVDVQKTPQILWMVDENYRFLFIKIREGTDTCILFDGIAPGKAVAVMNLTHQKPLKSYGEALANQYTILSSYPQQTYLQEFLKEFIDSLPQDVEKYLEECKNLVNELSCQNLKRGFNLNAFDASNSEEDAECLTKKLCGLEDSQLSKYESLTLSDEEMALIDTQVM